MTSPANKDPWQSLQDEVIAHNRWAKEVDKLTTGQYTTDVQMAKDVLEGTVAILLDAARGAEAMTSLAKGVAGRLFARRRQPEAASEPAQVEINQNDDGTTAGEVVLGEIVEE